MNRLKSRLIVINASALLILMAGCGGGGGGGTSDGTGGSGSGGGPSTPPPLGISGVAMDGYLSNALVFYDLNDNGVLDAGEPSTKTNAAGQYFLPVTSSELGKHKVMLVATANQTTDADSPAAPISATYTLSTTVDHPEIISPLTTYVAATAKTSNLSSAEAEAQVKSTLALGNSSVSLFQDFADKTGRTSNPELVKLANHAKVVRAHLQTVVAANQGPCAVDVIGTAIAQLQLNIDAGKVDLGAANTPTPISDDSAAAIVAKATGAKQLVFQSRFSDETITLNHPCGFGGPAGVQNAPNDAAMGFVISNYIQADDGKLGLFRSKEGAPYDLLAGTVDGAVTSIAANDNGDAVFTVSSPTTGVQFVHVSGSGSRSVLGSRPPGTNPIPMPAMPVPLNDGRFLELGSSKAVFSDPTFAVQTTVPGPGDGVGVSNWSGYGRDGLLYSNALGSVPSVRFADGTLVSLPCNAAQSPPGPGLAQPSSGRNCIIEAASSNGIVAGPFVSAAGDRGIFRFTKTGFEEVVIDAKYWGRSAGSASNGVTSITGIANNGAVLLSAAYSDSELQTCAAGPFVVSGAAVMDLKPLIPTQDCMNIQAGISGGGKVFMSSQKQGINLMMTLPE